MNLRMPTPPTRTHYPPGAKGIATRVAASRAGAWFIINVLAKIDPLILKATRGRFSSLVGQPVLLLKHHGAKSGRLRETPLVYALDGDDIVLVGSKGGSTSHPAWYHNLMANHRCEVIAKGRSGTYEVIEATGADRDRLWEIALEVYAGYDTYQSRTDGRIIPVLVLRRIMSSPVSPTPSQP
jgi:deazaflavin-dependent oxidoreductase (nitroreductase family)